MKTPTQPSLAYKLGQCLGWPMAWVLKMQMPIVNWLTAKGVSKKIARLVLITANLTILIAVLLAIIPNWLLVITIILVVILFFEFSEVNIEFTPNQERQEWRTGWDGYGLYDNELNIRIDCGSEEDS